VNRNRREFHRLEIRTDTNPAKKPTEPRPKLALAPAVDSAHFLRIPALTPILHRNIYPHGHPAPTCHNATGSSIRRDHLVNMAVPQSGYQKTNDE
jgi:hypothetical protein